MNGKRKTGQEALDNGGGSAVVLNRFGLRGGPSVRRFKPGRHGQKGLSLIEITLGLIISAIVGVTLFQAKAREAQLQSGQAQGQAMETLAEAVRSFAGQYRQQIATDANFTVNRPDGLGTETFVRINEVVGGVPGVPVFRPTVAQLINMGHLPNGFSEQGIVNEGRYQIELNRFPNSANPALQCLPQNCGISGLVFIDQPLLGKSGGADFDGTVIGAFMGEVGRDSFASLINPAELVSGDGGSIRPNPVAGPGGALGVIGVDAGIPIVPSGLFQDLVTEDLTVTGNSVFQGPVNIQNSADIDGNLNVDGTSTFGGLSTFNNIQVNGTATIATGNITTLNATTGNITTVNSTTVNGATGNFTNLNVTNNGAITNLNSTNGTITNLNSTNGTITNLNSTSGTFTNLTVNGLSDLNGNLDVQGTSRLRAEVNADASLISNGRVAGTALDLTLQGLNIGDACPGTMNLLTNPTSTGAAGFNQVRVQYAADQNGNLLQCYYDSPTPYLGPVGLSTVDPGAACGIEGRMGMASRTVGTIQRFEQLICKNGLYIGMKDLVSNYVMQAPVLVRDADNADPDLAALPGSVTKPVCGTNGGGVQGIPLIYMIPAIENTPDLAFNRFVTDAGASWTVHLKDGNNTPLPTAVAFAIPYCFY